MSTTKLARASLSRSAGGFVWLDVEGTYQAVLAAILVIIPMFLLSMFVKVTMMLMAT